jgi:hypothetical protein
MPHLIGIEQIKRAFKEGASKLAHSKGFASGKKYAALGETAEADKCIRPFGRIILRSEFFILYP